jgi:hypothetical protein
LFVPEGLRNQLDKNSHNNSHLATHLEIKLMRKKSLSLTQLPAQSDLAAKIPPDDPKTVVAGHRMMDAESVKGPAGIIQ